MTVCQHIMVISPPEYGQHQIGKCKLCGHTVDYTLLQAKLSLTQRAGIDRPARLYAGTMENIMKARVGK